MNESQPSSDRERNAAAKKYRLRRVEKLPEALHAVEADDEKALAETAAEPPAGTQGVTEKVRAWDVLQGHPIAQKLDTDTQLALVCEYVDQYEDLQGLSLAEFIDSYFAADDGGAEAQVEESTSEVESDEDEEAEPSGNEYDTWTKKRPPSMVGMRVVYRFPGRNVLSDANGVTSDETVGGVTSDYDRTVAFTDVDGEEWSNARRHHVYPIDPKNYREIHISPREAKEFNALLSSGTPSKDHPEGSVICNLTIEFPNHPDRITLAIMNGKKPYVDRFVALTNNGFADDQKPTTRLFGEHCFRVRGKDYIVNVVSP